MPGQSKADTVGVLSESMYVSDAEGHEGLCVQLGGATLQQEEIQELEARGLAASLHTQVGTSGPCKFPR